MWDYSISDIAKYSGTSFKTALVEVKKLERQKVVKRTRNVGNAIMYQFSMESKQAYYIDKLINAIATRRIKELDLTPKAPTKTGVRRKIAKSTN
jgi:DNA-binding Lrp family transcriptional regulator